MCKKVKKKFFSEEIPEELYNPDVNKKPESNIDEQASEYYLAGIGSWSACKHYNKDLSKNRKASQPWLPPQESYAFLAPSVFSHISEFLPWIKMNSRDVST